MRTIPIELQSVSPIDDPAEAEHALRQTFQGTGCGDQRVVEALVLMLRHGVALALRSRTTDKLILHLSHSNDDDEYRAKWFLVERGGLTCLWATGPEYS